MKVQLIGHDEKYALEQSLLTLFPGEKPVYGTVDESVDTRWARVTLTEDGETVLHAGDAFHCAGGVAKSVTNTGTEVTQMLVCLLPPQK